MIGNLGNRRVATIATASLFLAASVFVVRATGINSELMASLVGQSAMDSRTAVHDRLVGSRIPLTLLGLSAVSASETPQISDQAYIAIKTLVDRDNNALPARQSSQTTAVGARGRSAIRTDRTLLSCAFAQQNPEPD